ncbi:hypothetical protein [Nostoc sp.]
MRYGNCSTRKIEEILRSHVEDIQAFDKNPDLGLSNCIRFGNYGS